jgi:hypothetical protein
MTTATTRPRAAVRSPGAARWATARLSLPTLLSALLLPVAGTAAAIGFFNAGIYRDAAMTAGNARGTSLVILAVALPVVAVSLVLAARGSLRAQIVWLGALGYILYNSLFFAYAVTFNRLFLLYVAALSLALWSVITLVMRVDTCALAARAAPGMRVRPIAGYLLLATVLFLAAWLRDILPALIHNTTPASLENTRMLTNPVQVTDLSFAFSVQTLGAIWLWRRRPWGYLLGGALLVMLAIEGISVTCDQIFGHISDPAQSLAAVPLFAALTVIGVIPAVLLLRGIRPEATSR